jgi:Na+-driven multidrug efflux pump
VMIILMPVFGINQGVQPIIGYNYGARRFDRVKKALLLAITAATVITTAGFILSRVLPVQLIRLFSKNDPALVELGVHAMGIFLVMLPIVGFQIVSANYFQAVGKPKQALFLSLCRQLLLLIPAIVILPRFFGLNGLWFAGPASDFGSSVLAGLWLFFELRNLDMKQRETSTCPVAPAHVHL